LLALKQAMHHRTGRWLDFIRHDALAEEEDVEVAYRETPGMASGQDRVPAPRSAA